MHFTECLLVFIVLKPKVSAWYVAAVTNHLMHSMQLMSTQDSTSFNSMHLSNHFRFFTFRHHSFLHIFLLILLKVVCDCTFSVLCPILVPGL